MRLDLKRAKERIPRIVAMGLCRALSEKEEPAQEGDAQGQFNAILFSSIR